MRLKDAGSLLRQLRKERELTIEEVVKEMECHFPGVHVESSDISRLENGRVTTPSLDKTIAYAIFLGLTPNEIAHAYGLWEPEH